MPSGRSYTEGAYAIDNVAGAPSMTLGTCAVVPRTVIYDVGYCVLAPPAAHTLYPLVVVEADLIYPDTVSSRAPN